MVEVIQVPDSHAVLPRRDEVAVQAVLCEQREAGRTPARVRPLRVRTVVRSTSVSVGVAVVGSLGALINVCKTIT